MLVLERENPEKTKPQNLPVGTPFKYMKGQINATYIKTRDITNDKEQVLCLNTGEIYFPQGYDSTVVHPYTGIHPIVKPLTDTLEVIKIDYDKIKPGECFILHDTLYIKTDKDLIFNLDTKLLIEIKQEDRRKVIHMPFIALKLI